MKIAIGSDHAGYELKEKVKRYLKSRGHNINDFGTDSIKSVDYPDYAYKVAKGVADGEFERGVLICWTGNGMTIAANKVRGVRAALCLNERMAELARKHNDARILCMASLFLGEEEAYEIADKFFGSNFEGGRHSRRIGKIEEYECKD